MRHHMLLANFVSRNLLVLGPSNQRRLFSHVPVMADEIVELLRPENGKVFIDMTFGGGGHTRRLLETNKSITVVAVDRDPVAYKRAQELAAVVAIKSERLNINQKVIPIHGRFSRVMKDIHLSGITYESVNGVLFDLGASSIQYDDSNRGFSVSTDGPLDMRMDTTNSGDITAEDVINTMEHDQLALIFKTFGDERRSRKISSAIIDARALLGRIRTTHELGKIIAASSQAKIDSLGRYSHPATKVFQALRIFVNNELNELNYAIDKIREFLIVSRNNNNNAGVGPSTALAPNLLEKMEEQEENDPRTIYTDGGIAVVLTFHSLEDRIVKRHFSGVDVNEPTVKWLSQHDRIRTNSMVTTHKELEDYGKESKWRPILKHVRKPTDTEIAANPRSRSAKLRAAVRLL